MKKNMGTVDRTVRAIVAVMLAALYLAGIVKGTIGIVLLIMAVIFLITAFTGFCPLYLPFGISTCAEKK